MKQPSLAHVLQPKWRTALQRLREERANGGSGKLVVLALVGGAFWVGVFGVLYRILKALRAVEELGPLIPGKILGLILLSFISILVLSNVITALSQRRDINRKHVQTIVKITSELFFGDQLGEAGIRSRQ